MGIYQWRGIIDLRDMDHKITLLYRGIGVIYINKEFHNARVDIDTYKKKIKNEQHPSLIKSGIIEKKKADVFIIQVESLDYCVIGKKINNVEITPFINKYYNEGIYGRPMNSVISGGGSSDSEFAMINSYMPAKDRAVFSEWAGQIKNPENIFQYFKDKGYTTAFFHGNVGSFWNMKRNYDNYGVEYINFRDNFTIKNQDTVNGIDGVDDRDFFEQTYEKIEDLKKKTNKNVFAFIITLSSHHPYKLRKQKDFVKPIQDELMKDYINSIHYADEQIGKFVEKVKNNGDYFIVIYGDHHPMVPTPDDLGKFSNENKAKCSMTPLIMLSSGRHAILFDNVTANQTNILPTLKNFF